MFIKIFLLTYGLWAYYCPESVYTDQRASEVHDYLSEVDQALFFNNCEVEILLCDKSDVEFSEKSAPVAEIFILDDKGREAYLPIVFDVDDIRQRVKLILNKITFHYQRKDTNYEDQLGRTENYRFEMRKEAGSAGGVEIVELGIYATYTQLNQSNGNDSHWFVCK